MERHFRSGLSKKTRRWLCNLDTAYSVVRHITQQSADKCLNSFVEEVQTHDKRDDAASNSSTTGASSELIGYISDESAATGPCIKALPVEDIEVHEEEFYRIEVKDCEVQTCELDSVDNFVDVENKEGGELSECENVSQESDINKVMDGFKYVVMQTLDNVEECQARVSKLIGKNVVKDRYNGQSDEYGSEDVCKCIVKEYTDEYVDKRQIANGDVVGESVGNFGILDEMRALIEQIGIMMKVIKPVASWDNDFAREDVDTLAWQFCSRMGYEPDYPADLTVEEKWMEVYLCHRFQIARNAEYRDNFEKLEESMYASFEESGREESCRDAD